MIPSSKILKSSICSRKSLIGLFALLILLITLAFYFDVSWLLSSGLDDQGESVDQGENENEKSNPDLDASSPFPPVKSLFIKRLGNSTESEWLPILRDQPIVFIENDSKIRGLATKYRVVFESGHQAIAKPVEELTLVQKKWRKTTSQISYLNEIYYPRRSDRKIQGWSEVAAGLVSRVLGGKIKQKKIPCVIRPMSSKTLYGCHGCDSFIDWFFSSLPEHTVYMSLCAWMEKLTIVPPPFTVKNFLTEPLSDPSGTVLQISGDISDVILFDFLVDSAHPSHLSDLVS